MDLDGANKFISDKEIANQIKDLMLSDPTVCNNISKMNSVISQMLAGSNLIIGCIELDADIDLQEAYKCIKRLHAEAHRLTRAEKSKVQNIALIKFNKLIQFQADTILSESTKIMRFVC